MAQKRPEHPGGLQGILLGCPMWGLKAWVGTFYRRDAQPREYLEQYSSVFNTVEGNTTFYGLPSQEAVARWRDQTPDNFHFSFKFPQAITHQRQLRNVDRETAQFLRRIAPLGERLGPIMLQFPKALSPSEAETLWGFLPRLPKDFRYAVELRHPGFFKTAEAVAELEARLRSAGCGRVLMDTRALQSGEVADDATREALQRKPHLPVHVGSSGEPPMIRFIGHPRPEVNDHWLESWVAHCSTWLQKGHRPYFFVHCPNNVDAPALARRFHALLSQEVPVGRLPPWPCEAEGPKASQLELF